MLTLAFNRQALKVYFYLDLVWKISKKDNDRFKLHLKTPATLPFEKQHGGFGKIVKTTKKGGFRRISFKSDVTLTFTLY